MTKGIQYEGERPKCPETVQELSDLCFAQFGISKSMDVYTNLYSVDYVTKITLDKYVNCCLIVTAHKYLSLYLAMVLTLNTYWLYFIVRSLFPTGYLAPPPLGS